MIKREYIIKNDKLCYVNNDPAYPLNTEVECTKEELTAIIIKQDKNKAELSDEYLGKLEGLFHNVIGSLDKPEDKRYDVAKSVLNSLIARVPKTERLFLDTLTKESFHIADIFLFKGGYNK